MELSGPWGNIQTTLALIGRYNLMNALQAAAICHEFGLTADQIAAGLSAAGIRSGDSVIIQSRNSIDAFSAFPGRIGRGGSVEARDFSTRIVRGALPGRAITLADDALTRDSTLMLERAPARTAEGVPLSGRETARPERFRLVKTGARCVLVHERAGRRFTLASATCEPLLPGGVRP